MIVLEGFFGNPPQMQQRVIDDSMYNDLLRTLNNIGDYQKLVYPIHVCSTFPNGTGQWEWFCEQLLRTNDAVKDPYDLRFASDEQKKLIADNSKVARQLRDLTLTTIHNQKELYAYLQTIADFMNIPVEDVDWHDIAWALSLM